MYIHTYIYTDVESHNPPGNYKMLQRKHLQIGGNHILNNHSLIIHVGAFNPNKQVPNSKTGFFLLIFI